MAITRTAWTDDDGTGTTGTIINNAEKTTLYNQIDALVGDWVNVTHAGGNFTGSGSITWTVASEDQLAFRYRICNGSMLVVFSISGSSVSGTGAELWITIPASKVATIQVGNPFWFQDNGSAGIGLAQVDSSGTVIKLFLPALGNWAASTNATSASGQIEFQIN